MVLRMPDEHVKRTNLQSPKIVGPHARDRVDVDMLVLIAFVQQTIEEVLGLGQLLKKDQQTPDVHDIRSCKGADILNRIIMHDQFVHKPSYRL